MLDLLYNFYAVGASVLGISAVLQESTTGTCFCSTTHAFFVVIALGVTKAAAAVYLATIVFAFKRWGALVASKHATAVTEGDARFAEIVTTNITLLELATALA